MAPLKRQSIPRLELLGAKILARLMYTVQGLLKATLRNPEMYYWTDSITVLCWIKHDRPWKQYIQRRVEEIHKLTERSAWKFGPGKENPADIPPRSCNVKDLINNTLWWKGPSYLRGPSDSWPRVPTHLETEGAREELKKCPPLITYTLANPSIQLNKATVNLEKVMEINRYGSKLRLLRITATILVATEIFMKTRKDKPKGVMPHDMARAERCWIRTVQYQSFEVEYRQLQGGKKEVTLKQLSLFMDDGVIRCRGRINQAAVPVTAKNPILLPPKHWFTTLIIRDRHELVHHNGIGETLNSVRL